jgi:hypothetical protein
MTKSGRHRIPTLSESKPAPAAAEHEGATESAVGERTGPGAGYDQEPKKERSRGGVV